MHFTVTDREINELNYFIKKEKKKKAKVRVLSNMSFKFCVYLLITEFKFHIF